MFFFVDSRFACCATRVFHAADTRSRPKRTDRLVSILGAGSQVPVVEESDGQERDALPGSPMHSVNSNFSSLAAALLRSFLSDLCR